MSVRAYRIKKIDFVQNSSFNLWHDTELLEYLEENGGVAADFRNADGGVLEIYIEVLEDAIKELKLEPHIVESIKADIKSVKKAGDYTIQYYCF
jgi:hypothetical protein